MCTNYILLCTNLGFEGVDTNMHRRVEETCRVGVINAGQCIVLVRSVANTESIFHDGIDANASFIVVPL